MPRCRDDDEEIPVITTLRRTRRLVVAAVLTGCLSAAGCGSGNAGATPKASSPANTEDQMLLYIRCMRQHGVDMPDDPEATSFPKPAGGAPALQAAEDACRALAPPKMQNGANDPAAQDRLLAVARCLRDHGLNVPDPQPGQGLALPPGSANDPKAQQALNACMKPTSGKSG
jgi:hypothetical protein